MSHLSSDTADIIWNAYSKQTAVKTQPCQLILFFRNCQFSIGKGGEKFSMQLKPIMPLLRVKSVSAACLSNLIIFYPGGRQGELQWNLPIEEPRGTRLFDLLQAGSVYYSHYHVVCPTKVPKPLHRVIARVSSFNFRYFSISVTASSSCLSFLPRLPVTSILTFIFPSTTFLEGSSYTSCDQSS